MTTFNGQTYFDLDAGERARDVALAAVGAHCLRSDARDNT